MKIIILGPLAIAVGLSAALAPTDIWDGAAMRLMPIAEAADAMSKEAIAAQLRKQGFVCDNPLSVERDRQNLEPNKPVWVLKCDNATYRVRPIPHRAADVERID